MSTIAAALSGTGAPTRSERLGGLAMTGALLLLCTAGLAVTSIQAHTPAPSTTTSVAIGR